MIMDIVSGPMHQLGYGEDKYVSMIVDERISGMKMTRVIDSVVMDAITVV